MVLISTCLSAAACVSPPRPSTAAQELKKNPKAFIEGRVVDVRGNPVAGLRVDAIPHAEIPWSAPAETGTDGRFRLELLAPGDYSFALSRGGRTVVTDDPRDPSRVRIRVAPGGHTDGIELLFLEKEWESNLGKSNNL
ncbi:MAG TPA: carboxypeptidase-like regulatory domain-containing protein [Thermoanaerobaculia bacterium]|nr:carboxypeptidase-like regulatory domain-containing protein [Thermoanaerobaculia bacterium]